MKVRFFVTGVKFLVEKRFESFAVTGVELLIEKGFESFAKTGVVLLVKMMQVEKFHWYK